ncbi:MAG: hypothetical protein RMX68_021230 [Aulosira sp. ZfuVER01]|nr:hypothetical protein [Aulosira sp. ZfuVER01]MDZ8002648.1 hypothetical protein [Aulosira sp. DedVER01a]MDZ8050674.1 hypothetical protein [Aulosira sp. ZfuCHP01]
MGTRGLEIGAVVVRAAVVGGLVEFSDNISALLLVELLKSIGWDGAVCIALSKPVASSEDMELAF